MSSYLRIEPVPEFDASLPLRLLIVEDAPEDAELIVLALEAADVRFTYQIVENLTRLRTLFSEQVWDAVLSDFRLTGASAYQVLEALQQTNLEIPLILVTGTLGEEAAVECIKAGITDYVLKDRLFRLPMVLQRSLQEFKLRRQQRAAMLQIQQQAQREHLLNQIGRALNSSLDPDYILQEIVKITGECFGVERVFIFAVQEEQVRISHEWRANAEVVSMLNYQGHVSDWLGLGNPGTGKYFMEPVHLPSQQSTELNEAQQECMRKTRRQSLLSVPIFIRDQFFGGIELHTTFVRREFADDEINLLRRIADQSAIALYNAQSYERLEELVQERTQELEAEKLRSDAASRAKTDFLANMSHELRTPLTSILGFSSVLLKQVFGSLTQKQEQYLTGIHTSGEHLLELINDLLDLSKIEAGREDLLLEPNNVQEICQACLEYVREQATAKELSLNCAIAPDVQTCIADRRRLKQILVNLLSNAVKFTDAGSVSLNVHRVQNQLQFAVEDTGIGIAPVDMEQLFQPFHQVHSGLDRKYQGTGLGLALARKLAQLHGGTITVASELGRGSCFTLNLPAQQES
ncbi:MAG: response regulator [Oscillatoriales cyanobacterium C42_A2020_001]|nr:response regulator [Leptolyngbyaceae cyanobacterium C42_A2020_001]